MKRKYVFLIFFLIFILAFFAYLGILIITGYNHESKNAHFSDLDILLAILLPIFALIYPLKLALKKKT